MEELENSIRHREAQFISQVQNILSTDGSTRTKIALIYKQYIRCSCDIDDLVSQAKLERRPLYNN